jgi:hypothetical protein
MVAFRGGEFLFVGCDGVFLVLIEVIAIWTYAAVSLHSVIICANDEARLPTIEDSTILGCVDDHF